MGYTPTPNEARMIEAFTMRRTAGRKRDGKGIAVTFTVKAAVTAEGKVYFYDASNESGNHEIYEDHPKGNGIEDAGEAFKLLLMRARDEQAAHLHDEEEG